jgi:2-C-methyl-D-erythritol 4-phosphate cytidylyltransferase
MYNHIPISIVIVAGGSGSRMGLTIPKQFALLNNLPVLCHSINLFSIHIPHAEIIVVLPESEIINWKGLCKTFQFETKHQIAVGGKSRQESVKNGVEAIFNKTGIIAVHDAARPLVSKQIISNGLALVADNQSAIPYISMVDSARFQNPDNTFSVIDRNKIKLIQTPQFFNLELFKTAIKNSNLDQFTDDASVFEASNGKLSFFEGENTNIKITNPIDLKIAQYIINS